MIRRTSSEMSALFRKALEEGYLNTGDCVSIFIDFEVLQSAIDDLQQAFPKAVHHAIAIKSNPLRKVWEYLSARNVWAEAASMGEVQIAREAGFTGGRIVFDSPAKTMAELKQLSRELPDLYVNADSFEELARHRQLETPFKLGLRINPSIPVDTSPAMQVSNYYSKFGELVSGNEEAILKQWKGMKRLVGLHVHAGSQIGELQGLVDNVKAMVALARWLKEKSGKCPEYLDIGGGFPVNYGPGEAYSFKSYADLLQKEIPDLFDQEWQVITEFGRAVHAHAGWVVTDIEYVKERGESQLLIGHAGADLFLRECYVPGTWPHQTTLLDREGQVKEGAEVLTQVAGPLCFGGDFPLRNIWLPKAAPGDKLIIHDAGANTFALWSHHCSRVFPKVVSCTDLTNYK